MSRERAPLHARLHRLCVWLRTRDEHGGHELAGVRDAVEDLLVAVAEALTFPVGRDDSLDRADRQLVRVRVLLQVITDAHLIPRATARWLFAELDTVGRMLGGWRRSRARSRAPPAS
ncbi:MAG: hypothetical protein IPM29_04570 [Planctomycetes bacterium]|nr:hypothetical protein [Planctomycetota bacterium]